jgi:glutaminyl-peptide cyclotransferase
MKKFSILLCVLAIVSFSCNNNKKDMKPKTIVYESAPNFDADSAYFYVNKQVSFGYRVPNTKPHQQCSAYLAATLRSFCDTVYVQNFIATNYEGTKLKSQNIIGSFAPEKTNRILLGAHWDSRPFADHDADLSKRDTPIDGANDGASGVGVLLEIARQLAIKNPEIGIDIIFFDAEDWGPPSSAQIEGDWWCLGSQYWSRNPHKPGYRATYGILLDMVGGKNAQFFHEGVSIQYAQNIVSKIWGKAHRLGFKEYFINQPGNPIIDDHLYVNQIARIPMVNIIHQDNSTGTGFNFTWHTTMDNMSNIDKTTLEVVGKTVLAVIYSEK